MAAFYPFVSYFNDINLLWYKCLSALMVADIEIACSKSDFVENR